ncbi:MAG: aminotransferase class I/II-fold pyridoxal phosphate-dependent enzyme [Gammaproteobacteria bacterium]|nr:aminotransferase class I/II-fold pyridoxal phosphate-dependent enzyme [Gammaproteobacteria bacterium]MDE0413589.1 aminotransferase class I/II-fold pyridoxal phosphate-dependent enzyme [Gammaproteobacteria bacterium]
MAIELKSSRLVQSIPRSGIREIFTLAETLENVIHLEIGEPNFDTPPHVIDAACSALRSGATRYTSNAGILPLREAIAARISERTGRSVSPDRVIVANGAVGALYLAAVLALERRDEVLIPDPCWPNYLGMFRLVGAEAVRYRQRPENGFLPDLGNLQELVSSRTKALLLNSPSNPTGSVIPMEKLSGLVEFAESNGLYVISDEIYEDIVYEGEFASVLECDYQSGTLCVSGVSKGYAMTGFRLGYIVVPDRLVDGSRAVIESVAGCITTVSQHAAISALSGPQDGIRERLSAYRNKKQIVLDTVGDTGRLLGRLQGAFYAMIDVGERVGGSMQFAKDLLQEKAVAVSPGITFGADWDHTVRISYAVADEQLRSGLKAMLEFLEPQGGN